MAALECSPLDARGDLEMDERAPNCSICLEPVVPALSRSTAQLACSHHFHLDCIGSAFNAKGAMECPNCRRVEDGNWLMLGSSQSTDEVLYEVPYEIDDEEYLTADVLDREMREYAESGRDIGYTTHPYHPHGVICEFCEQHYCDDIPCPHIVQCPYFSNITQAGSTDNHFGSSISSMEAEAYAEAIAELYHEYQGPPGFSGHQNPRSPNTPEMQPSSSSVSNHAGYYFSATPEPWQGGPPWGESAPPQTNWATGWTQDSRQEATRTTTLLQSSTMITTYGPPAPSQNAASFPTPPSFPALSFALPLGAQSLGAALPLGQSQVASPALSPRTPLQAAPLFGNRHPFPEAPPPPSESSYPSLSGSLPSREGIHTSSSGNPGPLTYANVLNRRQVPRRHVNAPQDRPAGPPWRTLSDVHALSERHSPHHYHHSANGAHATYCPYLANARAHHNDFHHTPQPDPHRGGAQQSLSTNGGSEQRHARRGENSPSAEGLLAMLELNDGLWLQDRNSLLMCTLCMDQARPRFQSERRFVNRDALSQHMRAVHGVHLRSN